MMKKFAFFLLLGLAAFAQSCSNGQSQPTGTLLDAAVFSEKLKNSPDAALLDVRTPEEYAKGHLPEALNINWTGNDFETGIARLDKGKPVFVYCLSGVRSAAAAEKMRSEGFKTVIELEGGIMKWRAAQLPESGGDPVKTQGM